MDFSLDKAKELLDGGLAEAQELIQEPAKVDELLVQLEEKLKEVPAVGDTLADVPLMIAMVKGYITRTYSSVSPKVIASLVAAFLYLVKRRDLVPDNIPVVGLADDVAVLALAMKLSEPELAAFKAWRDGEETREIADETPEVPQSRKRSLGVIPAVFPMPVLMVAAYDEAGKVNVMNVAWGMISDMDKITLFIGRGKKTLKNIQASKAFTVSLADRKHMDVADFFGIASGNTMTDKFERTGYHAVKSELVNAPLIEEFPLVMECELEQEIDTETFHAVVGRIVNVQAEEAVLDETGKVDPAKLDVLMFDQFRNGYYTVGGQAGKAWNAGKDWMKK